MQIHDRFSSMSDPPLSTQKSKLRSNFSEYTRLKEEIVYLKRRYREGESEYIKEIAVLQQKIELQRMEIEEYKDQAQMQKDLYDTMVNALKVDNAASKTMQGQVQIAQKIYQANISELKKKHEELIEDTIRQFTQKWEHLYAYIKDAEKLLEDMDLKRKKERKELTK